MIGKVSILGLGTRGNKWLGLCSRAGWEVAGFDPDDRAGRAGKVRDWKRADTISSCVSSADWVICCLPERLDLLRPVLQRAQAEAPETAVIAVTSRVHDIEAVQGCAIRPGNVMLLTDGEDGGLALDLSAKNDEAFRTRVAETLAGFAAVLSLTEDDQPGAQDIESRGA